MSAKTKTKAPAMAGKARCKGPNDRKGAVSAKRRSQATTTPAGKRSRDSGATPRPNSGGKAGGPAKPATPRKRELISQREYARRRGVSHTAVQHAVKSGRISTVDGKIDPAQADREWRENTDQSKPRNRITGRPKHTRVPGEPSEPMDFAGARELHGGNGTATGYAKARAARELYQAQLVKLELDRQRAILVRADEVRVAAFNMARMAQDQLIALPHRVAAILAATEDAAEVRRILEEEIEQICQEISDGERQ